MNRLLATTALGLMVIGSGAYAQSADTSAADAAFVQTPPEGDMYGTDLIGMEFYATSDDISANSSADARSGWDDIGEINDLLVSSDGKVDAVIADIGGFLGMGAHTIAVSMDSIHVMTDESGTHFAAMNATKDSLEAAPEFNRGDDTQAMAPADNNMATGTMAAGTGTATGTMAADDNVEPADTMAADDTTEPSDTMAADETVEPADTMAADTDTAPAANNTMATAPAADDSMAAGGGYVPPEGYAAAQPEDLTAETLDGAEVYNGDNSIGSISELVLDPDGKITQAVVDVGGFLGIGAHSVALDFDKLHVANNADTGDVRVDTDLTKDELKQMPEYEG